MRDWVMQGYNNLPTTRVLTMRVILNFVAGVYHIILTLLFIMFDSYSYTFARFRIPKKHVRKTLVPCILNRKRSNASVILHSPTKTAKCRDKGTNIVAQFRTKLERKQDCAYLGARWKKPNRVSLSILGVQCQFSHIARYNLHTYMLIITSTICY